MEIIAAARRPHGIALSPPSTGLSEAIDHRVASDGFTAAKTVAGSRDTTGSWIWQIGITLIVQRRGGERVPKIPADASTTDRARGTVPQSHGGECRLIKRHVNRVLNQRALTSRGWFGGSPRSNLNQCGLRRRGANDDQGRRRHASQNSSHKNSFWAVSWPLESTSNDGLQKHSEEHSRHAVFLTKNLIFVSPNITSADSADHFASSRGTVTEIRLKYMLLSGVSFKL